MADTEEQPQQPQQPWGPFRFHTREVDGHIFKLHFRTTGSPEAPQKIVFIHGLMAPFIAWDSQIEFFEQRGDEYECLFIDNRGIGLSDVPEGPYSTPMMAADALSIVRTELGWKRFAVVGASMGGMITQHVGLQAGDEEVSHLLLCCTRAKSTFWSRLPSFYAVYKMILQNLADPTDLQKQASLVMPTLYSEEWLNKDGNRERMEQRFVVHRGACPPDPNTFNFQFAAVKDHELTNEEAKRIKEGKYIVGAITGDDDHLVPHSNTQRMPNDIGAEIKIIPGVGHGVACEAAAEVNEWIVQQLKREN